MVSTRTLPCPAIAQDDLTAWLGAYETLHIDIGTGDGAFALTLARQHPGMAVLGIDTCLENLTKAARRDTPNLRFVACDARDIPAWLGATATGVSINFPYGALLRAVAGTDAATWERMLAAARTDARIDIRINASAGTDHGLTMEGIQRHVETMLRSVAPRSASIIVVPHYELRSFPSTWAKRLAYGKPSQVIVASALLGG